MSAFVVGSGLGLFNSNTQASLMQATLGQAKQNYTINLANGNLVLQGRDQMLVGQGTDINLLRTYNSQGKFSHEDDNHWGYSFDRRLLFNDDTIIRISQTGHRSVYHLDAQNNSYYSTDGEGAHDTIKLIDGYWVWQEGSSLTQEKYHQVSGHLGAIVDSQGNGTRYLYDTQQRLIEIQSHYQVDSTTTSNFEKVSLVYNAEGLLSELITHTHSDSDANFDVRNSVRYHYDSEKRLIQVEINKDATHDSSLGVNYYQIDYQYDAVSGKVERIMQSDGTLIRFDYVEHEGVYRISKVTYGEAADARSFSMDYNQQLNETRVSYGDNENWVYEHQDGKIIKITAPEIDGNSSVRQFFYDADDNLIRINNELGQSSYFTYDQQGNLIAQYDELGNYFERSYNDKNQLLNESRYQKKTLDSTPFDIKTQRYIYDTTGTLLRYRVSAEGRVNEYRYNSDGQLIQTKDFYHHFYDTSGLELTDHLNEALLNEWRDNIGKDQHRLTEYRYDFRGSLTQTINYLRNGKDSHDNVLWHKESIEEFVYDAYGNLLNHALDYPVSESSQVLQYVEHASFAYDGLQRITLTQNAKGTTRVAYHDEQHQIQTLFESGLMTTEVYNTTGDIISQQASAVDSVRKTQYFYDHKGRLQMTLAADNSQNYIVYDAADRMTALIDAEGSVTGYEYNAEGQKTAEIFYSNLVDTRTWFSQGVVSVNLTKTHLIEDHRNTYDYDAGGRLSKTINAYGLESLFVYDSSDNLVKVTRRPSNAEADDERITRYYYDQDGLQIGEMNAEGFLTENQYNAAGQLIQVTQYANKALVSNDSVWSIDKVRPTQHDDDLKSYFFYDEMGREILRIDPKGFVSETKFDFAADDSNGVTHSNYFYHTEEMISYLSHIVYDPILDSLDSLQTKLQSVDKLVTKYYKGENGRLHGIENAAGGKTEYVYDESGRLSSKTYTEDYALIIPGQEKTQEYRQYVFQYNQFDELVSEGVNSEKGHTPVTYQNQYVYDSLGQLISAITLTDRLNNTMQTVHYFYDKVGRLLHTVNGLGEVTANAYNAFDQVISEKVFSQRLTEEQLQSYKDIENRNTYLANHLHALTHSDDSELNYRYQMSSHGLLKTRIDQLGYVSKETYNSFEELIQEEFEIEKLTRLLTNQYDYDKRGLLTRSVLDVNNAHHDSRQVFDAFGRLLHETDANGKTQTYRYQDHGRTLVMTDRVGGVTKTEYDALGRVLQVTDTRGYTNTTSYESSSRSITTTSPEGIQVTQYLDHFNNTIAVKDSMGEVTQYIYDEMNNLISTIDAHGTVSKKHYDSAGRLIEEFNHWGVSVVTYVYDAANRVVTRTENGDTPIITRYEFDTKGQQVSIHNANGTTSSIYDKRGYLVELIRDDAPATNPSATGYAKLTTRFDYDGMGNQIKIQSGNTITQVEFNNLGQRIAEIIDPNGLSLTIRYEYDNKGEMIKRIDANGKTTYFEYDHEGRILAEFIKSPNDIANQRENLRTDYTYDIAGNLTEVIDANGIITQYNYNKDGQKIEEVIDSEGYKRKKQYVYNHAGQLFQEVDANNIVTQYDYNA
ncbi:MAG: DUF6531 domain-containing protein, partial [Pseudomonadota bacterium]